MRRGYGLSATTNVALLVGLWAGSIVAIGFVARVAWWLFCLGFGCAP